MQACCSYVDVKLSNFIFIVQLCCVCDRCSSVVLTVIYRERPVINTQTVDLDYLESLPQGTFGREYADWLRVNVCTENTSVYLL